MFSEVDPAAMIAYILAGIIVYCVTLCLAELTANSRNSGSFIPLYSKDVSSFDRVWMGWLIWLNWIIYIPLECIAGEIKITHTFLPS
ncbi:hypothetical protein ACP8HZ_01885 [Francisella noatunensis]